MSDILLILFLFFFFAAFVCLISVIYPIKAWGFKGRLDALKKSGSMLFYLLVVLTVYGVLFVSMDEVEQAIAEAQKIETEKKAEEARIKIAKEVAEKEKQAKAQAQIPKSQRAFTALIQDFANRYDIAETDFQKGSLRPARKREICKIIRKRKVRKWVGYVSYLSTNNDGYGVLDIKIADGITISTFNNSLSDIDSNTLIKPSDPVFSQLGQIREGDKVLFSGRFIRGTADCIKEKSLTIAGSLTDPEFIMRFSNIQWLEDISEKPKDSKSNKSTLYKLLFD